MYGSRREISWPPHYNPRFTPICGEQSGADCAAQRVQRGRCCTDRFAAQIISGAFDSTFIPAPAPNWHDGRLG